MNKELLYKVTRIDDTVYENLTYDEAFELMVDGQWAYIHFMNPENLSKLKLNKEGVAKCLEAKHLKPDDGHPPVSKDICTIVDSWLSKQKQPITYEVYNGFIVGQKKSKLQITQEQIDKCLQDKKVDIPVAPVNVCQLVIDWLKTTPKPTFEQYQKFIDDNQSKIDKKTIEFRLKSTKVKFLNL
jgi:hypothetical protein